MPPTSSAGATSVYMCKLPDHIPSEMSCFVPCPDSAPDAGAAGRQHLCGAVHAEQGPRHFLLEVRNVPVLVS